MPLAHLSAESNNHLRHSGSSDRIFGRLLTALLMAAILVTGSMVHAQDDDEGDGGDEPALPVHLKPNSEFVLPKGDIKRGDGRRVLLEGPDKKLVVGRIYVEGDKRYLVTMPDGSLVSVDKGEVSLTDRPFKVKTAEEMEKMLLEGRFEGFKSKRTKRFIYIYECSDTYFKAANMILETMYPKLVNFCKKQGLDVRDPEFPLVVIMFGDREGFDDFDPNTPPTAAAYYNNISNYVVMYENQELTEYSPTIALKESISTMAHEGVHQILRNTGVQYRFSRWPMWIGEGLPEYCAPTESGKRIRWKGVGQMNSLRMYSLLRYREHLGKKKRDWFDLEGVVEAQGLTGLGYAHAWGIVYGMAKSRKTKDKFSALLQDVSKLGPLEDPPEKGYYFRKHFGTNNKKNAEHIVAELNKGIKKKYVDPVENQTYFVAVIETPSSVHSRVSPSIAYLKKWAQGANEAGVIGKFWIQDFPNRTQARKARAKFVRSKL